MASLRQDEYLRKCERLAMLAAKHRTGDLLRFRKSERIAGGTEVRGHRDYTPGEDFRHIDWHLAARHDELRIRQFPGDEDPHVYVMLDVSESMRLGTPSKLDLARQLAGALSLIALNQYARVGLVAFADRVVADHPLVRGRRYTPSLLRFVSETPQAAGWTRIGAATTAFSNRVQRHGRVFVISDFCDESGFRSGIDVLRRRGYEPYLIQVHTPGEANPRALGDAQLTEIESGSSWSTVITRRGLRKYRAAYADFVRSVQRYSYDYGLGCLVAQTDRPFDHWLSRMIHMGR